MYVKIKNFLQNPCPCREKCVPLHSLSEKRQHLGQQALRNRSRRKRVEKAIFDKTFKERLKTIKEQQKAVEQVTINYYLADTLKSEIKRLIDYTKRRYKTTTRQAIEIINTDNVKRGLFEDIQADIKNFVGENLSNDKIISLFNQEFKKALKTIKEQTPKEQKSQKDTNKLIKAFLLIKKW